MDTRINCPICEQENWESIERYTYAKEALDIVEDTGFQRIWRLLYELLRKLIIARPRKRIVAGRIQNSYQKLRWEVLFNVWFPTQKEIDLISKYCRNCGLATFFPRPTDEDIANKYAYLKEKESSGEAGNVLYVKETKLDTVRAKRIYNLTLPFLGDEKSTILDYGGGDGKLLKPFLEKGQDCYLVDYNDQIIPGVTKIGDDLSNYSSTQLFDLIICSHVIEHVSNIGKLIQFLKAQLQPEGIIYAEVPHEIWAGIFIETDPVTHLNFFTVNALKNLFLANGFKILAGKRQMASYGKRHIEVIWVVAQKSQGESSALLSPDIKEVLFPSSLYSLKKIQNKLKRN